jgi:Uncharacterized conserved protein related to C-terminal domain of eukaryotic chaperone, SACSIN
MIRRDFPDTELCPHKLTPEEIVDPYLVISELFQFDHLPCLRELHWEFFKSTVTGGFNRGLDRRERYTLVHYYELIGKLIEAAHILYTQYRQRRKHCKENRTDIQHILTDTKRTPVQKIIDVIAKAAEPEKVFTINITPDFSEPPKMQYDYLALLPAQSQPYDECQNLIESACGGMGSVIVAFNKAFEVSKLLQEGHIFYSLVCQPGNLVYDKGATPLPLPEKIDVAGIIEKARTNFGNEFKKALSYLNGAKYFMLNKDYNLAAHLLHQATEHTLRAVLISLTGHNPYGHNLFRLLRYSLRITTELCKLFPQNTDKEKDLLTLLNLAYSHTRYRNDYEIGPGELCLLLERVDLFQTIAQQVLENHITTFQQMFQES